MNISWSDDKIRAAINLALDNELPQAEHDILIDILLSHTKYRELWQNLHTLQALNQQPAQTISALKNDCSISKLDTKTHVKLTVNDNKNLDFGNATD